MADFEGRGHSKMQGGPLGHGTKGGALMGVIWIYDDLYGLWDLYGFIWIHMDSYGLCMIMSQLMEVTTIVCSQKKRRSPQLPLVTRIIPS